MMVSDTRSQSVELTSDPNADSAAITDIRANQGSRISISADYIHGSPSAANVLSMMETVWGYLQGKEFTLHIVTDRAWTNCAVERYRTGIPREGPLNAYRAEIEIVSAQSAPNTSVQLSFANYASEYPYAAVVGRPSGSAATPGTAPTIVQASRQIITHTFAGIIDAATPAGQEYVFKVGGSTGSTWKIKSLHIGNMEIPGTGTTTVRISTAGVGGAGSNVDATCALDEYSGAEATGNITVTAGDTVYLFVTGGGGGQGVAVIAHIVAD